MLVARVYEWQICEGFRDFCDFKQRQTRESTMHMHICYPENIGLRTRSMFVAQDNIEVEGAEGQHCALGVCRRSVASSSAKSKDLEGKKLAARLTFYELHRVASRVLEVPLVVEAC